MLVFKVGIHEMLVRISNREDPDQSASSAGFKLGPDSMEKRLLPPGKSERSDNHIGRSYSDKMQW